MSSFHLDRNISLGIILTLAVQSAGALMWGGAAEARIKAIEHTIWQEPPIAERLARLEEQVVMARASLARIEHRLDQKD